MSHLLIALALTSIGHLEHDVHPVAALPVSQLPDAYVDLAPLPPLLSYAELRQRRREFLHLPVRIVFQFGAESLRWNPGLTRFGRRDYRAFEAYSDERFPWVARDVENPEFFVFAARGGPLCELIAIAEPFQRFEATVIVRELFAGKPWMEALAVRPLDEWVGEGSVIHTGRAVRLMQKRVWKLALAELERAAVPGLPPNASQELEGLSNVCRAALAGNPPRGMGNGLADRLRRQPLGK